MFYRPGPGGCYVCCVVVEGFGEQGEGGMRHRGVGGRGGLLLWARPEAARRRVFELHLVSDYSAADE